MPELTRRRLFGTAGAMAAAAFAAEFLPPNVRRAMAGTPRNAAAKLADIKHVVILMQENRSFDHYFGTLPGVRGFSDPDAITLSTGRTVFHQPDTVNPLGYLLPFHLDTRTTSAQSIPSTSHAWPVQHNAWNAGRMDNWLPAHRAADGVNAPYVMGHYTREDAAKLVRKNIVTRALGVEREVQVDLIEDTVEVGDLLLLCSDGLSDMISDDVIQATLSRYAADLDTAAQRLIELANDAGGKDNVSVVLARADASFARGRRWYERLMEWF